MSRGHHQKFWSISTVGSNTAEPFDPQQLPVSTQIIISLFLKNKKTFERLRIKQLAASSSTVTIYSNEDDLRSEQKESASNHNIRNINDDYFEILTQVKNFLAHVSGAESEAIEVLATQTLTLADDASKKFMTVMQRYLLKDSTDFSQLMHALKTLVKSASSSYEVLFLLRKLVEGLEKSIIEAARLSYRYDFDLVFSIPAQKIAQRKSQDDLRLLPRNPLKEATVAVEKPAKLNNWHNAIAQALADGDVEVKNDDKEEDYLPTMGNRSNGELYKAIDELQNELSTHRLLDTFNILRELPEEDIPFSIATSIKEEDMPALQRILETFDDWNEDERFTLNQITELLSKINKNKRMFFDFFLKPLDAIYVKNHDQKISSLRNEYSDIKKQSDSCVEFIVYFEQYITKSVAKLEEHPFYLQLINFCIRKPAIAHKFSSLLSRCLLFIAENAKQSTDSRADENLDQKRHSLNKEITRSGSIQLDDFSQRPLPSSQQPQKSELSIVPVSNDVHSVAHSEAKSGDTGLEVQTSPTAETKPGDTSCALAGVVPYQIPEKINTFLGELIKALRASAKDTTSCRKNKKANFIEDVRAALQRKVDMEEIVNDQAYLTTRVKIFTREKKPKQRYLSLTEAVDFHRIKFWCNPSFDLKKDDPSSCLPEQVPEEDRTDATTDFVKILCPK